MGRKKATVTAPTLPTPPTIHEATRGGGGSIHRGAIITQAQAESRRQAGLDVVICGPSLAANSALAQSIEQNANGTWKRCPPHQNAGPNALPHYQPDPRPPTGHTFYETANRKAH